MPHACAAGAGVGWSSSRMLDPEVGSEKWNGTTAPLGGSSSYLPIFAGLSNSNTRNMSQ